VSEGEDYFCWWDGRWVWHSAPKENPNDEVVHEDEEVGSLPDHKEFRHGHDNSIDAESMVGAMTPCKKKEELEFLEKLSDLELGAVERFDSPMQRKDPLQPSHLPTRSRLIPLVA
jgi:hypothetical protein